MKDETKISLASSKAAGSTGDRGAKNLFGNKEIVAPLLEMVVPEFKGMPILDIIKCIEGDISSEDPVNDIPLDIKGEESELSSVADKVIRFDKSFKALNPLHGGKDMLSVYLHINLEMQNQYKPSFPPYPMIKRGIYYAARQLQENIKHSDFEEGSGFIHCRAACRVCRAEQDGSLNLAPHESESFDMELLGDGEVSVSVKDYDTREEIEAAIE